ncbi:hypothetical protein [Mucilaginibacter gotjawali]|uniref:Uncharacterized protein n=1 Tax=Mucilaginibacter gotjawali TaxID=1550579 RepID=A0A839SHL6_9SPHI|nr:hypothetical protein [Mucilaginibacter gotjawali]MBB3057755.1 hypothetical protein [Mucilaginibacter gotjawali]
MLAAGRVESLQLWGIIPGDEEKKQNKLATKVEVDDKEEAE